MAGFMALLWSISEWRGEREGNRQLTQPTLLHLALAVVHRNHCHCRFRLFSCSCPPSSHLHCGLLHTTEWASGRPPPGLMWAVTMPRTRPPKNPKQWPENPTQWPEAIIRGLRHSEGRYRGTGARRRSGLSSSPLTPRPPPPPPPPSAHRTTTSFMAPLSAGLPDVQILRLKAFGPWALKVCGSAMVHSLSPFLR